MSKTKVSTKPSLHDQHFGASGAWPEAGLLQAAFEGRLERSGDQVSTRSNGATPRLEPAARDPFGDPIPLHVRGTPDLQSVWPVESRPADEPMSDELRSGMIRALGFLAVALCVLLVLNALRP